MWALTSIYVVCRFAPNPPQPKIKAHPQINAFAGHTPDAHGYPTRCLILDYMFYNVKVKLFRGKSGVSIALSQSTLRIAF